ncbi:MAG: hypothetical protein JWO80_4421 [Bryobacterales bacterium]|nr:hypothetical protein [Bryobacterales bacterium]
MRLAISAIIFCSAVIGVEVPKEDSRNTNTPGTDTHFAPPVYTSREAWEKRKEHLRKQILSAAGLYPMPPKTPLHPRIFGRIENRDCTIEKVLVETIPGYYLGGNLYRPLHATGKHPAILNPHGHWTYGRLENQPLYSGPSLGINLARQGYVVFAWDMVGYNDTVQTPHIFGSPVEQLWSFGPLGLQVWNAVRALDFVVGLDDVDPARLAMTGASGGATQTILLAAIDDRLQFAAPVNMVSSIMQGGDFCENAPGLRVGTNNVEIAAMFAPKPMLLVSATGDWTRNTPTEEFPAIQKFYALYGKPDNVETLQLKAPHNYNKENREAVYRFFGKHILGETDAKMFAEKTIQAEMLQNMLALSGRALPDNAITYDQVFAKWKEMVPREAASADEARERLQLVLGAEWTREVVSQQSGEHVVLSRPETGDRVEGALVEGKGAPVLIVGGGGVRLSTGGRPTLRISGFQPSPARNREAKHFLTFNQSDDACRVQDILTALAWLHNKYPGKIELVGVGPAAVWAEFAAAVSPIPVKLSAELGAFRGTDEDFLKQFNVPGIQRAGGLPAAERLIQTLK